MSLNNRERSSSLFIISEGQFYSKPSIKLERLEKDYSELKKKENEDEIELRRLRTENLLLKQRIDNLEKESASLADKLVQDKVAWAQNVEQLYAVRTRLSTTLRQLRESQNLLHDSENTMEELSKKNQICTDQIRRVAADNKKMQKLLEEITQDKKAMQAHINALTRKLDDTESSRKEEAILARIQDAEHMQQVAELRRKLAEIDIQKVETLTIGQIRDQTHNHALVTSSRHLQNQQLMRLTGPGMCAHHGHQKMVDSLTADSSEEPGNYLCVGNSDDEFDALVRDSENLERTLSDIIEGRHNSSTIPISDGDEGRSSDSLERWLESSTTNTVNSAPVAAWRQVNTATQVVVNDCVSRQLMADTIDGIANVDDVSDDNVDIANFDDTSDDTVDIANVSDTSVDTNDISNVDDISDDTVVGIADVGGRSNDEVVGVVNICCDDNTTAGETRVDDLFHEYTAFAANFFCTNETPDTAAVGLASEDIAFEKIAGVDEVISNDNIVGLANIDFTDEKIVRLANVAHIKDTIVGVNDVISNDNIAGLANVDFTDEKIVRLANVDHIKDTIVGVANVDYVTNNNIVGIVTVDDVTNDTFVEIVNVDDVFNDTVVGIASVDDVTNDTIVDTANVDDVTNETIVDTANVDDVTNDTSVGILTNLDNVTNEKIVGIANADNTTDENIVGVANVEDATNDIMVGIANIDNATNNTIVGVANVEDATNEIIIDVASFDDITDNEMVDVANGVIGNEPLAIVANDIQLDVTRHESRFKRVDGIEHADVAYRPPSCSGAVMSLFGYKGEASLMLKESTV